jgi:lipoprotein-releasing system permease protein
MDDRDRDDPKSQRTAAAIQLAIGLGGVAFGVLAYFGVDRVFAPFVAVPFVVVGGLIVLDATLRFFGRRLPRWMVLGLFGWQAVLVDAGARELVEERTRARQLVEGEQRDADLVMTKLRRRRNRGLVELAIGVVAVAGGVVLAIMRHRAPSKAMVEQLVPFLPIAVGFYLIVAGTLGLLDAEEGLVRPSASKHKRNDLTIGFGFKSFVAWRYLMARHHRVSRVVLYVFFGALFLTVASLVAQHTLVINANPLRLEHERLVLFGRGVLGTMVIGVVLLYFSILVGLIRYVFSFFTTVPLVGVWIGTGALVCVLSVMSGFETDLRQKILGSNAHIQVTAESGDINNWREVKAQIDQVPGVLASTPYAVSEVVIAANNNGMNVIIKGIDPESVGKVTKLVDSIKDDPQGAMRRLEPLVSDVQDLTVPQRERDPGEPMLDAPPDDMPDRGDPIDFSQPYQDAIDTSSNDAAASPEPPLPEALFKPLDDLLMRDRDPFGGDAEYLVERKPLVDPPPPDLIVSSDEPTDYSGREPVDLPIHVVDRPWEPPLARRTQSLPGILVGKELVKQTHLHVGEEVRVVSPLSDPANPDATGTPIPFNRDYRVAGIFFTGMYEYDLKYVYVTLDSLTDFLDRGDVVDGIEVRISNADDTDRYVAKLQLVLGKQYRIQDWKELNRSLFSALKLEKIAMFLVLGIVILVASFSIVGNLIMVVVEKAREIALLKTLGSSDSSVMLVFAIQGLLIGIVGTALGVATGLLACWFGKEYGIPLNPDVYYIDKMPVHVETTSVVVTAIAGVVISMLATFYPAVVAARVRPAAGMRH